VSDTPRLDQIADGSMRQIQLRQSNTIWCRDGFVLTVFPDFTGIPLDYSGLYSHLEVVYPSMRPEPWDEWARYTENAIDPTLTGYQGVPTELVRALIESHGGER
jgi:hypothetical protein